MCFRFLKTGFVFLEERDKRFDAFFWHGIVYGGPESANGLVALEIFKSGSLGSGYNGCILFLGGGDEGDVHQAAHRGFHGTGEEFGLVQEIVHDLGFLDIAAVDLFETADGLEILEYLTAAIDGPAVGSVIERTAVRMGR